MFMKSANSQGLWVSFRKSRPQARLLLLCFPYAGGGALAYRPWVTSMPAEIDVLPVQLPGRERRLREPPYVRTERLIESAAPELAPHLDRPFAIFGHSMGALIGYELSQWLRRERGLEPTHLLVSARRAIQLPPDPKEDYKLTDDELIERLREINGTPPEVLEHPELMELMLPLLRADFELNDTYRHKAHPPLGCPMTALGGLEDPEVSKESLEAWSELTDGTFRLRMFPGDHFYLNAQRNLLVQAIVEELQDHL